MKQVTVTTAMGKRLIGMGMAQHPSIKRALQHGTLAIIGGTTNGYVAEEVLKSIGVEGFLVMVSSRRDSRARPFSAKGRIPWRRSDPHGRVAGGATIRTRWTTGRGRRDPARAATPLTPRDSLPCRSAATSGGTAWLAVSAVIGRRVELIVPIGLEKRVLDDVYELALICNAPGGDGAGFFPLPARIFTELDAIRLLTGAEAKLLAGGGVYGAEGASWLMLTGESEHVEAALELVNSVAGEPVCEA